MMHRMLSILAALIAALALATVPAAAQDHAGGHGDDRAQSEASHDDHSGDDNASHGDDHGGHGDGHDKVGAIPSIAQGLATGITAIVVFGIVAFILNSQVWPKITTALDERSEKIQGEIEAAEQARAQAKQALEQYEASLAEARAEAQKMIDDTKAQQATLAADLRAKSEAELADLKDRARRDIESAKRAAISEVYAQASILASTVAGKILEREVSSDDQQRLVEEALRELAPAGDN